MIFGILWKIFVLVIVVIICEMLIFMRRGCVFCGGKITYYWDEVTDESSAVCRSCGHKYSPEDF